MRPLVHGDQGIVLGDDEAETGREDGDAILAHLVDHLTVSLRLARAKRDDIAAAGIQLVLTHLRANHSSAGSRTRFGKASSAQ